MGYTFSRNSNTLTNYVNDIYKIKSNPINNTQKSIAKGLSSNLLGIFGIHLEKTITELVSVGKFNTIVLMKSTSSYKNVGDNKILVNYTPSLDYDLIKSHELDFVKVASKYNDSEVQALNVRYIAISADGIAYAINHI